MQFFHIKFQIHCFAHKPEVALMLIDESFCGVAMILATLDT